MRPTARPHSARTRADRKGRATTGMRGPSLRPSCNSGCACSTRSSLKQRPRSGQRAEDYRCNRRGCVADVLLRAFWDAFEATDDVALFVRTSLDERAQAELKVRARAHAPMR